MTRDQIDELMRDNGIVVVGEAVYALCQLIYEAGRKDENEACAKVCEGYQDAVDRHKWPNGYECAAAIRAKGQK